MILLIFIGFCLQGGAAVDALFGLVNGVRAKVFWIGVVGIGMGIPLFSLILPGSLQKTRFITIVVACCSLTGVLAPRHFVLYAGPSYIS